MLPPHSVIRSYTSGKTPPVSPLNRFTYAQLLQLTVMQFQLGCFQLWQVAVRKVAGPEIAVQKRGISSRAQILPLFAGSRQNERIRLELAPQSDPSQETSSV